MLTTSSLNDIDELVKKLACESDKWMSLAIAIDLADEVLKILLPNKEEWQRELNRDSQHTGALPQALPLNTFKNQKQVKWFNSHPELTSARSAFKLFNAQDCTLESNFFWFSESATKQKIATATEYSQNWEDSELTRKPQYKVGIDFFLTPEANSLLVVLSNHQKLRVLELHGHLSNTQKLIFKDKLDGAAAYTGIENGVQLEFEPQRTIHTTLWNALQLKEVNKQFYGYIAGHFKEVVDTLQSKGKTADDAKQFSSRLLGRLLFVWFLRKMDIINESVGYFDTDDLSATEYYEQKLKTLFFQTLNTEIGDRTSGDLVTPYLNGGLFEAKENDFAKEVLEFPKDFFTRLFNHFDEFNFTTDESSADYELIAVDPEMLGQVFESLLASQVGEDDTNERNNTGSFYTPREIVGYMVKETLRQYLYSKLDKTTHKGINELLDLSDSQWLDRKSTSNADVWGVNSKKVISEIKVALDNFKVLDPAVGSGAFPMGMLQQLLKTYERIKTRFDPYELKLSIIENNIFGIDLQPMAIEISRLRAWLSVIVDETDKNNIKSLPNLDFKFISANSLLKLEEGQTDLFTDPDLDIKLQDLRNKYFNARKSHTKKDYQNKYYRLTLGQGDIFEDERTRQLKTFDPFKNLSAAEFFDPHVMFGITDGFDAVIGNPPYIHFESMKTKNPTAYKLYKNHSKEFTTYAGQGDIYALFYEKGIQFLKEDGILTFITSNKWMRARYGRKLGDFLLEGTNPLLLIDLGPKIFDSAVVDTNILMCQKSENRHNLNAVILKSVEVENIQEYIRQNSVKIDFKIDESWVISNGFEKIVKDKINLVGIPLKDWNIKIRRGILTGFNNAFLISKEKRDELVSADPRSDEILKPVIRGRDVKKYECEWAGLYLIATFPSKNYNIDNYPIVRDYLLSFGKKRLEQSGEKDLDGIKGNNARKKTKHKWFETQDSIAYADDFAKSKMIWKRVGSIVRFSLDNDGMIPLDSTCIAVGEHIPYLVAVMNTKIGNYLLKDSPTTGTGDLLISVQAMDPVKIPIPTKEQEEKIVELMNSQQYDQINEEVGKLYSFSKEELDFISSQV